MSNNILQINPYSQKFYDIAFSNLAQVLTTHDTDLIEIQFKYAQVKHHLNYYNEGQFKNLPALARKNIQNLMQFQTGQFLQQMKMASKQNVIYLNPFGKQSYQLQAGFNEKFYQKFYHIRDLFKKIGNFNKENNYKAKPLKQGQRLNNIYHELSLNASSELLRVTDENELRMDIYIKDPAPQYLQSRYSFSSSGGWIKTKKEMLCHQMDYLQSEYYFRMAINKETEQKPDPKILAQLSQYLKTVVKHADIRLKRAMRVQKGNIYEISLSEIYNIYDVDVCRQLGHMVFQPTELQSYLRKKFINFYSQAEGQGNNISWEMELQFSKQSNLKMKKLIQSRRYPQMRIYLQNAMGELYSIFFADHTIKMKEIPWMNYELPPQVLSEGRLDNQFGTYMREHLYREMSKSRSNSSSR